MTVISTVAGISNSGEIDAPAFDGLVRGRPAGSPEGAGRLGIDEKEPEAGIEPAGSLLAGFVNGRCNSTGLRSDNASCRPSPSGLLWQIRCPPDMLGEAAEVGRAKVMLAPAN